ncbi:MAG: hypothetical protein ACOC9O_03440, partial [Myxococcota bacterium]
MTKIRKRIDGAIRKVRTRVSSAPPRAAAGEPEHERLLRRLGEQTWELLSSGAVPVPARLRPTVDRLGVLLGRRKPDRPEERRHAGSTSEATGAQRRHAGSTSEATGAQRRHAGSAPEAEGPAARAAAPAPEPPTP